MKRHAMLALSATSILIASAAAAENAQPTYQADPDTYKLIFEDQNFRVIAATWKKGTSDKPHAHPLPFVIYQLDDCTLRLRNPDGSTRSITGKAGTAFAGVVTASHTSENPGAADCHAIFVERK